MKITNGWSLPSILYSFVLLQYCTELVHSAYIPVKTISKIDPSALIERAVTWADTKHDDARSSVCSEDQKKTIEQSMQEAADLARAGSKGFDIILDMMSDNQAQYKKLTTREKHRYKQTYFTFYGRIKNKKDKKDINWHTTQIKWMKERLDRIANLDKETWPESVRLFCDSTYFQDVDDEGKTKDEIDPPLKDPPAHKLWKYDWDKRIWAKVLKPTQCSSKEAETVSAYTLAFPTLGEDRITYCPKWFEVTKEAGPTITDLSKQDIEPRTPLSFFARRAGRIVLHEHLHTHFVNQDASISDFMRDVEGSKSYGAVQAAKYGEEVTACDTENHGDDCLKASRNIENAVYWSIAMYYDNFDWSTIMAREPSDEEPGTVQNQ